MGSPGRRRGQRHAAPYCVFTSTLERERWWENCLGWAPSERKWTRCRRAHANTASNNGATRRGFWQPVSTGLRPRALPRQLGARPDGFEGHGLAAAEKLAHNARCSRSGVSRLILTSPCPAHSAGRLGRTPYFRYRPLRAERTSNRPLPKLASQILFNQNSVTDGADIDRTCLWAPSLPCRQPCVQLVASHFQGEQPAPGASKITFLGLAPAQSTRDSV
jgi:hypothetical protein